MTSTYKLIQLTNSNIQDVAVNEYIPLGTATRRVNAPYNCCNTFKLTSSTDDTLVLNDSGFYKITYSLTASAAAEGDATIALVSDGNSIYSVTSSIAAADSTVNLTLVYVVKVCPICVSSIGSTPTTIQIQNTGVALTGTSSNMIVEKI